MSEWILESEADPHNDYKPGDGTWRKINAVVSAANLRSHLIDNWKNWEIESVEDTGTELIVTLLPRDRSRHLRRRRFRKAYA